MKIPALLFIPALLLAAQAGASCVTPPVSTLPAIPDGNTADKDAMFEAQDEITTYISSVEAYLDCRDGRLSKHIHNGLVSRVEEIATDYNQELRKFRIKEGEIAQN